MNTEAKFDKRVCEHPQECAYPSCLCTTAPRAAEAGEDAELARFLVAGDLSIMFHDGKGRSLSVEEKVTILNALCASSRPAIIEESPAPAEVAEGAGLNPISNAPWDEWEIDLLIQHIQDPRNAPWLSGWSPMQVKLMLDGLAALRAAPSLTKEEWGMLNAVLDDLADGLIGPSGWATLRAKVREWAKSRP